MLLESTKSEFLSIFRWNEENDAIMPVLRRQHDVAETGGAQIGPFHAPHYGLKYCLKWARRPLSGINVTLETRKSADPNE